MKVHHFSEDPTITRFVPHVPLTNPTQQPAVWAIDEEHSPVYWFPRDCPRITVWPRTEAERGPFAAAFSTRAHRLHVMELAWLNRMRDCKLYRYDFDATAFSPWTDASGQWISHVAVAPLTVSPVGDLLALHAAAGIELRLVPSLWPMFELAQSDAWDFSIVRKANAQHPAI